MVCLDALPRRLRLHAHLEQNKTGDGEAQMQTEFNTFLTFQRVKVDEAVLTIPLFW